MNEKTKTEDWRIKPENWSRFLKQINNLSDGIATSARARGIRKGGTHAIAYMFSVGEDDDRESFELRLTRVR